MIKRSRVVSRPGAAIEVTELELTEAGARALTTPRLALPAYRGGDDVVALRAEVERLRAELAARDAMPVYSGGSACRKCNAGGVLAVAYEPARRSRWFRAGSPERMRRKCGTCGAVYFEQPHNGGER